MVSAPAIYARISQDRSGEALGVRRQVQDCQAEAQRRGWPTPELYVDDDISAHSGRVRPQYQRLLDDISDRHVDAVIVWHLDRLHRQPRELEAFVDACAAVGLKQLITLHGEVDIGSGDGMLMARIMAAVAANESDAKSRRVRRKLDERAQQGRPHGGPNRPYGYEPDKVTVRQSEAKVVRELAERLLAGESLTSLARWLNDEQIVTTTGKEWRTGGVRNLLMNPRLSGQRVHRGQIAGRAAWDAIITPEQTEAIRALLSDPDRRTNRTARRYALAGMLRCGECSTTLLAQPRNGVRRYVCKKDAGLAGCGKLTIDAARVEELIANAVLLRLDTPALADTLAGKHREDSSTWELHDQVAQEDAQLVELADMYGNHQITMAEWSAARKPIEARLKSAKQRLGRAQQSGQLDGLIGTGSQLRGQWSGLNLDRQRAIITAALDHAVVHRYTAPGLRRFDPDRVEPFWRL